MCLFESSHHVFDTCSAEEVLLFYDVHLHFFRRISVLIEQDTGYSFCSLSCFYQINIIIICLAMKFVILGLKRGQCRPQSQAVCVKSIIPWHWSIICHCFYIFTVLPENLLNRQAIDFFSFFSQFSIILYQICHIISLNLPGNPLRVAKIRNLYLLSELFDYVLFKITVMISDAIAPSRNL